MILKHIQLSKFGRKAIIIAPDGTGSACFTWYVVAWNFPTATHDGAAQVEEAGDDDAAGTDDDDFQMRN